MKKVLLYLCPIILFLIISQSSFSKDICSTVSECMKNGYKLIKDEVKVIDDDIIKIFQLKKKNTIVLCATPVSWDGVDTTDCKII